MRHYKIVVPSTLNGVMADTCLFSFFLQGAERSNEILGDRDDEGVDDDRNLKR
jgi:hypothetical protein